MQRRSLITTCGCTVGLGLFSAQQAAAQAIVGKGVNGTTTALQPSSDGFYRLPQRVERPSMESDEGGLWAVMDREEKKLQKSRFLIRDETLNSYIASVACNLGQQHCAGVRVYVVNNPQFNANMAPNGMMQIWSGLLLRTANEAQLASVLGHEIGHYLARHSIQALRADKNRAAFGTFLSLFGAAGSIGQLALVAGGFAYSRDNEREADLIGIDLMAQAGYDPAQAGILWRNLLQEIKANNEINRDLEQASVMFATHPAVEEREQVLNARARGPLRTFKANNLGQDMYQKIVGPYRRQFAQEDLGRRRFAESQALYQRMIANTPDDWDAHFFLGEVYRTRGEDGDLFRADRAYEIAARNPNPPPVDLFRSQGLVKRHLGRMDEASSYFKTYLEKSPQAQDVALIEKYIRELG